MGETSLVRLAVLDSYAVRWDRETFARDLMQNFFDADADFSLVRLELDKARRTASIWGPAEFDLRLLFYIGATTKDAARNAGGFGEGFKICALVGLRDFGLRIVAGSGPWAIEPCLEPVSLGRELCYRLSPRAPSETGSFVRLEGCDDDLLEALRQSPRLFRHPLNPNLQRLALSSLDGAAAIYLGDERARQGELYYRRQRRGAYWSIQKTPLTLAYDLPIPALEGDRDRRDLPVGPLAQAVAARLEPADLRAAIELLRPIWEYNSELLGAFLGAAIARGLTFSDWPPEFVAADADNDPELRDLALRGRLTIVQHRFSKIGMRSLEAKFPATLVPRAPTPFERARFQVGADLYARWTDRKEPPKRELQVFDSDNAALHGAMSKDTLTLNAALLRAPFLDKVAGTILHELSHEMGGEVDARFLRRLQWLLTSALRRPQDVRDAVARYDAITPDQLPAPPPSPPASPALDLDAALNALRAPSARREREALTAIQRFNAPRPRVYNFLNVGFERSLPRPLLPVTLCAIPLWPLLDSLKDRLQEAAERLDLDLYLQYLPAPSAPARRWPHLQLSAGPLRLRHKRGQPLGEGHLYAARFGPQGDCLPDMDTLLAFLDSAKARPRLHTLRQAHRLSDHAHRRWGHALERDKAEPSTQDPTHFLREKLTAQGAALHHTSSLRHLPREAVASAAWATFQAAPPSPLDVKERWERFDARIQRALALTAAWFQRLLRDGRCEQGERFDEDLMSACEAVGLRIFLHPDGDRPDDARQQMERLWSLGQELLLQDIDLELKSTILWCALLQSPLLSEGELPDGALEDFIEAARRELASIDALISVGGPLPSPYHLEARWITRPRPEYFPHKPDLDAQRRRDERRAARGRDLEARWAALPVGPPALCAADLAALWALHQQEDSE